MPIKKEKIFNKINSDFNKVKDLINRQFDILEAIIKDDLKNISVQTINEFNTNENNIDKYEIRVNENIILFMVLQQPVASDLRQIIAYFRMISSIERIGDQLNNIFNSINKNTPKQIPNDQKEGVLNMLKISRDMLNKALISFDTSDRDYAIWTIKNDELVDNLQEKLLEKTISRHSKDIYEQNEIKNIINMNSILSNIERIADNATNIAEASIYYQDGLDVRHQELENIVKTKN